MTVKTNVVGGGMIMAGGRLLPWVADKGDKGDSVTGPQGWSPVLAGEGDGTRTLIKVIDWTGGAGTKPAVGMYLGTTGYVMTKAAAFNFNAQKRVAIFTGATAAGGIATLAFVPPFDKVPPTPLAWASQAVLSGVVKAEIVTGSLTASSVQVKVTQAALITGIVTALVGAVVNVLVIEG